MCLPGVPWHGSLRVDEERSEGRGGSACRRGKSPRQVPCEREEHANEKKSLGIKLSDRRGLSETKTQATYRPVSEARFLVSHFACEGDGLGG